MENVNAIILMKNRRRSVALVYIEVNDQDPMSSARLQQPGRCHGKVIQQTNPLAPDHEKKRGAFHWQRSVPRPPNWPQQQALIVPARSGIRAQRVMEIEETDPALLALVEF